MTGTIMDIRNCHHKQEEASLNIYMVGR